MIETSGVIEKEQGNGFYLVTLEQPAGHQCLCRAAGKLTKFRIKLLAGDKVLVEISPYDLTRGLTGSAMPVLRADVPAAIVPVVPAAADQPLTPGHWARGFFWALPPRAGLRSRP